MNPLIPLKTYQGLSVNELSALIDGRDAYIWGCGHLGQIIKRCFDKNGLAVKSFCDSNPRLISSYIDNVPVVDPKDIFNAVKLKQAFIIIASAQYRNEIEEQCRTAGLVREENYLSYIRISRSEAAIDIAGKCNLKCPSCPQGNTANLRPEGYMPASVYKQVLDKLLLELPQLINIEISTWGEPFMNPDLAEIIEMTEMLVPCTVHTNLQLSDNLEDVIKAQPSHLIVSVSGFRESYEANHAGASWNTFFDNIHLLKKLIDKYNPKSHFTVLYHLYRNNQQDDLDNLRSLCSKLGLKLCTTWAYLNPFDKILDYCEGRDIGARAKGVLDILPWDIDYSLGLSRKDAHKPCLCQRIFPIINWDLSVSLCHVYYNPVVTDNFLEMPFNEILKLRHAQFQCEICQNHGLHRLDIEVLLKNYSAERILIND